MEEDAVMVVLEKLTLPEALRFDVAKLSPPVPVMPATVWVKPEPRFNVPEVNVTSPAVKALVRMVVPPVPFWIRAGKVAPDLGINVCAAVPVKAKAPVPAVIVPPLRKSAFPKLIVKVLLEKLNTPVYPEVKVMDLTDAAASNVTAEDVALKETISVLAGT